MTKGSTPTVLATYYYDAFGNLPEQTGSIQNPFRYAGYFHAGETGLYYLNARYYDSKMARANGNRPRCLDSEEGQGVVRADHSEIALKNGDGPSVVAYEDMSWQ